MGFRSLKNKNKFRVICFSGLGTLLVLHVGFALFQIITHPHKSDYSGNFLVSHYKRYATLGPFFTPARIYSMHKLYVRYKTGKWSDWITFQEEHFRKYHRRPWAIGTLKQARYEFFLGRYLRYAWEQGNESLEFNAKKLKKYISAEHLKGTHIDSLEIIYFVKWTKYRESLSGTDTIFHVKY